MALTRDKSEGSIFDPLRGIRGGPFRNPNYHRGTRLISVPNVEYTTLTQCRGWLPAEIGGILWIALGSLDTSCYIPFYAGTTAIPEAYSIGDHFVLNRDAARWAFDYVDFHVQAAYSAAIQDVREARKKWEDEAVARTREIDDKALALFRENRQESIRFLTGYCLENATNVIDAWWQLGDDIWVKYNHLSSYNSETRRRRSIPRGDTELWDRAVRAVDVLVDEEREK